MNFTLFHDPLFTDWFTDIGRVVFLAVGMMVTVGLALWFFLISFTLVTRILLDYVRDKMWYNLTLIYHMNVMKYYIHGFRKRGTRKFLMEDRQAESPLSDDSIVWTWVDQDKESA